MAIWDEQHESIDRDQLQALQLKRLQGMLARLYERVPHYRAKLDDVGFTPGDPKSLDDLRAFEKEVSERLRSALLVRPKVRLVEPGRLERTEGKAKRAIDDRPS
jgi:phenylacetate-coenzyme A ligase PaaK-like adenylate-forming protein